MKNKILFYILSCTWGLPMTLIGGLAAICLIALGYKPRMMGGCIHFAVGEGWGGINLGLFIITTIDSSEHTKWHEHGHAFQNCYFGLLMPFIVGIPSVIRAGYRKVRQHYGLLNITAYDDIWFEGQATRLGNKYKDYYAGVVEW